MSDSYRKRFIQWLQDHDNGVPAGDIRKAFPRVNLRLLEKQKVIWYSTSTNRWYPSNQSDGFFRTELIQ